MKKSTSNGHVSNIPKPQSQDVDDPNTNGEHRIKTNTLLKVFSLFQL